ncbi:tRNA (adenosine(37)-N6)-dimethylallyltransferase MiaA [Patescibacteria group bacterium]
MDQSLKKALIVIGPTSSGKTGLSVHLAKMFNGEIVSSDSRQVYRGMDIGTGKATEKEMSGIPHHCIDIVNPDEEFTAYDFQQCAKAAMENITKRGKLPIIAGGTGLYVKAVVDGLTFAGKRDDELRAKLEQLDNDTLFSRLKQIDPKSAQRIDPSNKQRVMRAIEASEASDSTFSESRKNEPADYTFLQIGIDVDRENLYEKINHRVHTMFDAGLEDEVSSLAEKYSWDAPALDAIGYRQFRDEKLAEETIIEEIQKASRRYAKRQLTWFRADKRIKWIKTKDEAEKIVQDYITS